MKKDKKLKLYEDQQEVLEWLKAYADRDGGDTPIMAIGYMVECMVKGDLGYKVQNAYLNLIRKEQGELLQAFGAWAVEEDGK